MDSIRRMSLGVALAGLWLSLPVFAVNDCALAPSRMGTVLDYRGECRDGRVHGVVDVMIELPPAEGRTRRARQFGWFQRGVPQGVHLVVLTDPEGQAPGFALMFHFDASGRTRWTFGLPASRWPKTGTLLASGPWSDVDGKARQAGLDYPRATRADGSGYDEGLTTIADIINLAVDFSMAADVQSADPASVRDFLVSIPIDRPLAGVRAGFSAQAIFPDTGEEAPAAREAAPQPAATPGLDELIRRAMGSNGK